MSKGIREAVLKLQKMCTGAQKYIFFPHSPNLNAIAPRKNQENLTLKGYHLK